jgi:hypothetical protein
VIQRPQQRAASALPHRFCFAEKLPILAIFGDSWQYLVIFGTKNRLPRFGLLGGLFPQKERNFNLNQF